MWKLFALLGAVPALVAMFMLDRADAERPEPRSTLRKVAAAGALSTIPAAIVELGLMSAGPKVGLASAFYMSFVVAALVEESCKGLCVRWFVWNRPEFDERTDGIVYGARAGLGFAMIENIGYLLMAKTGSGLLMLLVVRSILTVPMHAFTGALLGHWAAWRRFEGAGPGVLGGLALAVGLHGVFDVGVFSMPVLLQQKNFGAMVVAMLCPVMVVVYGRRMLRRAWAQAKEADARAEAQALVALRTPNA